MAGSVPYRIVYLNRTAQISGAEMSLLSLLNDINRRIFKPIVILPGRGPLVEKLRQIDVESHVLSLSFIRKSNPLPYAASVVRLARELTRLRPALVHSNVYMCAQYGVPASILSGVDFLSHVRLILPSLAIRNSFLSHARLLIANSYAVSKALKDAGIPQAKIAVVHNGVDTGSFSANQARRRHFRERMRIPEAALLLGCIGRFHPTKGQLELLEALAMVQREGLDVRCVFVGGTDIDQSAEYLRQLKERVRCLGIDTKVRFFNFREDIRSVYDGIDLLVLPSRQEPFGRVLIEAMSMGKPILAVDAGGPREIARDAIEGLFVRDNSPRFLKDGIIRALHNRKLLPVMGRRGRDRAKKYFSVEQYVQKLESIYLRRIFRGYDFSAIRGEGVFPAGVERPSLKESWVGEVGMTR